MTATPTAPGSNARQSARQRVRFALLWVGLLQASATTSAQPDTGPPDSGVPNLLTEALPESHQAQVQVSLEPANGVRVGELATLTISAIVPVGDRVTLPEQSFGGFELYDSQQQVTVKDGAQHFTLTLQLQPFSTGDHELADITLRVVTAQGQVGQQRLTPVRIPVRSLLANEPNAQPRAATAPVVVMEDDYTLAYIGGGLLAALAIAALTLLVQRYWRRRPVSIAPPPPRPPWEVAVEQLAALRERKQTMIDQGHAVEFVDEVSDVVRAYLGERFGFAGLDTTTAELLDYLRMGRVASGLQEEARAYLRRCDLVKFAKVEPDQDEVDLIFAKAQDIVQFSIPQRGSRPDMESIPMAAPEAPSR